MDTVRQYYLVKGMSGLIWYERSLNIKEHHPNAEILADNLTKEEAQALFKLAKGESNEH